MITKPNHLSSTPNLPLAGTTALITGAGRGIGRAIAIGLAQAGCNVSCVSRTLSEVEDVARMINSTGLPQGKSFLCDVADPVAISALAAEIRRWIDRPVHIVVNNADIARLDAVEHTSDMAHWNRIMATNLAGPVAITSIFLPEMILSGGGVIISIGSWNAVETVPFMNAYSVSKTGLLRFHEILEYELRGKNVNNFYVVPANTEASII
ncbi:hypothetical protein B0I35DRAFT_420576 [Stachybotrys elegans]|uniref:Uncharacterized protein n=1 Tax=Stachybotrys elegans TaxID=80388 RepID=A0A8K0T964_9HYPO|nr:hypothetical protein B0I35DRAFT_420576 [Stachybotrys elegans]